MAQQRVPDQDSLCKAHNYALNMLQVALKSGNPHHIQHACSQLAGMFKAVGQCDSALYYYLLQAQLKDSLTNLAKNQQLPVVQSKDETNSNQPAIMHLNGGHALRNRRIVLVTLISMLSVTTFTMGWFNRRMQKQKKQITAQSQRLAWMMKELHHRIKNNLQVISTMLMLQAEKLQDPNAMIAVKESQQRVYAMSLIHKELYEKEDQSVVKLPNYVTDLLTALLSAYGYSYTLNLHTRIEMDELDADKALAIGLIMNEVVTNALKHAYKNTDHPALHIELRQKNNTILLIIKDNGIGLDEVQWKQQKNSSFGKQLIATLCMQLQAEQQVIVHKGTQFIFTIPCNANA